MNQKDVAISYTDRIWNKKELTCMEELVSPHCIIHSLLGDFFGFIPLKKVVNTWLVGFPDLMVKNSFVVSENNMVVIKWDASGSHLGEFKGVKPTAKSVAYSGVTIYRIDNSQIAEYWAYTDMQHLLQQIVK